MSRSVRELLGWFRGVRVVPPNGKPKVHRRLWMHRGLPSQDVEDLRRIVGTGSALEAMKGARGWEELVAIKFYFQNLAVARSLDTTSEEKARYQAACEWQGIEAIFREVELRIRKGRQAEADLRKAVVTSP